MINYKLLVVLSIVVIIVINPACSDDGKKIVGEWVVEKVSRGDKIDERRTSEMAGRRVEFFSDQTTLWWDKLPGKWVRLEDNRIKIQGGMGYTVYFASISGDTLIVKQEKEDVIFKRYNPRKDIIGTWETRFKHTLGGRTAKDFEMIQQFFEDGRCVIRVIQSDTGEDFAIENDHYKFIDKNRIEMDGGNQFIIEVLSNDRLILTDVKNGNNIIYKRTSK